MVSHVSVYIAWDIQLLEKTFRINREEERDNCCQEAKSPINVIINELVEEEN